LTLICPAKGQKGDEKTFMITAGMTAFAMKHVTRVQFLDWEAFVPLTAPLKAIYLL
jgi:hypothetical protein